VSSVFRGPSSRQEWDSSWRVRDARPTHVRAGEWLERPKRLSFTLLATSAATFIFPVLVPIVLPAGLFMAAFAATRKYRLPLRLPVEEKGTVDYGNMVPVNDKNGNPTNVKVPAKPEGIFFLGNLRDFNNEQLETEELWITNSDARTHFLVLGTTGSGKSEMLLSMAFNAISWGSGLIYIDGKADTSLKAKMISLCRSVGREVDFYLLNFMTGDTDVWERQSSEERMSNTMNVFVGGSSNSATQLVSSLMPESGGDNAMWQGLAIGMINAVIIGLYFKRWKDNVPIDAGILRDHIEMTQIIKLAKEFEGRQDAPQDLVFKPLETYLLNLPGLDWKQHVKMGQPVGEDTKKQHDFRSMQFLRQLTMLADTYGAIFKHQIPEVEMLDVVLNRRILVVMIPSLEKSEEESQGVGKLVVASLKLMMALTLGSKVEGDYADIIDSKPTNAPSPFPVILDELGYYFTKGLAVMFAQARSLGFTMVAAGQDIPAMSKGSNKEEAESVIANTKYKIGLAMEDPDRTGDLLIKTADKAVVAETAGYTGTAGNVSTSYRDMMNVSLQERNRLTLSELRALNSGEGVLMWQDKLIRYNTFYAFGSAKLAKSGRLNHLIKLQAPSLDDILEYSEPLSSKELDVGSKIESMMLGVVPITYQAPPSADGMPRNEVLYEALNATVSEIAWVHPGSCPVSGVEHEIALFERLRHHFDEAQKRRESGMPDLLQKDGAVEFDDEFASDVEPLFALTEAAIAPVASTEDAEPSISADAFDMAEATSGWASSAVREAIAERTVAVSPMVSEALSMFDSIASGDLVLPEIEHSSEGVEAAHTEAERELVEVVKYTRSEDDVTRLDEDADAIQAMFADFNMEHFG